MASDETVGGMVGTRLEQAVSTTAFGLTLVQGTASPVASPRRMRPGN
jgi:hypothetical protein